MEAIRIREYAALMREMGLTGLEVSENGQTVRLEMTGTPAVVEVSPTPAPPPQTDIVDICSPLVGIFYSAPAENSAPYVQVGDTVRKGDVLCIIGAMKLMNEITSDQDGVITEICAGNNQVVDFGHVLFRVRKEPV